MRNPFVVDVIRQRKSARILVALSLSLLIPLAQAATLTWTGGGANDNWSTAGNWGGTAMNATGDLIQFTGSTRLTPVNDFATSVIGITFLSGAGAFTLSGNTITLAGDVLVSTTATLETINLGLNLSATRT